MHFSAEASDLQHIMHRSAVDSVLHQSYEVYTYESHTYEVSL